MKGARPGGPLLAVVVRVEERVRVPAPAVVEAASAAAGPPRRVLGAAAAACSAAGLRCREAPAPARLRWNTSTFEDDECPS